MEPTCLIQVEPSQVGSTRYVTHVISFTMLPCFSPAMLKSWEEPGYEATHCTQPHRNVCESIYLYLLQGSAFSVTANESITVRSITVRGSRITSLKDELGKIAL